MPGRRPNAVGTEGFGSPAGGLAGSGAVCGPCAGMPKATPVWGWPSVEWVFGGVLLSHPVTRAVPSALKGLASGFGMGPGVSPSL